MTRALGALHTRMSTEFEAVESPSAFQKLAMAMWSAPSDPSIYGSMEVDATAILAWLENQDERPTMTHVVARAVALAIAAHPEVNVRVRFGARLERRLGVDVFVSVATDDGKDLSGTKIDGADRKDVPTLARELRDRSRRIRSGDDPALKKSRGAFARLPWWLLRPAVRLTDLLTNELALDLPSQGLPSDPFGSAVVTSVGMFGIETAFAPFVPLGRCPMLILVPEVRPRPWVVGDHLEVRPVLRLCATFDHRMIDGFRAGVFARTLRELLTDPDRL